MGTYDISIKKWYVWASPIVFAISFALFFNVFGILTKLPSCKDFKTQRDAQALYLSNPIKYAFLDRNKDGVACNGI